MKGSPAFGGVHGISLVITPDLPSLGVRSRIHNPHPHLLPCTTGLSSPPRAQPCAGGEGEAHICHEAQLLPRPMHVLVVENLFSHGLLPPPSASDSADLKSASTSVLPGFWLGQQPQQQHRRSLPRGGARDAEPVSGRLLNSAQSHCPT